MGGGRNVSNDANHSANLLGDVPENRPDREVATPDETQPTPVPGSSDEPVAGSPASDEPAEALPSSAGEPAAVDAMAESVAGQTEAQSDEVAAVTDSPEEPVATTDDEEPEEEAEEEEEELGDVEPLELIDETVADEDIVKDWYILKVQVNREESIRDALQRRVKIAGLERYFEEIVVPTEDIAEFNKSGKRRIVKRKLYPGYIMVRMSINDDTWFLVRETPGIGDFTGSAGKPTPMDRREVERILSLGAAVDSGDSHVKTAIPFHAGDRVRVKEGYFQNFEGDVESVDEANGRVTVMINIFGRSTPVELEHWQIEAV